MSKSILIAMGFMMCGWAYTVAAADPPKPETASEQNADLPVRKAALFSSGVGYFEHGGTIVGTTHAELRFKTDQINDILKSLILEDLDGGKISTVVYPSRDPVSKALQSFQVNITANPSLGDLLNQLRGSRVTVTAHAETINGTILGLEQKQVAVGDGKQIVQRWVLNLLTEGTIRAVELEAVQELKLQDERLQKELNQALLVLASARDQDKKPVTINFEGQGTRRVRLAYVSETPIWKTSYRLIMPEGQNKTGQLQGWAIVENQTETDWNNIDLSLVSGRPISFVQDLYQPLYIPRPVVQPQLYASLRPQTYDQGLELGMPAEASPPPLASVTLDGTAKVPASPAESKAKRSAARGAVTMGEGTVAGLDTFAGSVAARAGEYEIKPVDPTASIASLASAQQIGELFEYTVGNVTLPRQQSAMIPIVTDKIEAQRVSIFNPEVMPKYPLNGALLKNTTGKHLLQGPITVFDGFSYAGDARIEDLPTDQSRLLSYGVDLKMLVDTSNTSANNLQTGKIVKGVLQLSRKLTFKREYKMQNKSDAEKSVIIEHPFHPNWKLVEPAQPFEKTDRLYRFRDSVEAGKTKSLLVHEESVQGEQIGLINCDPNTLTLYFRANEIPKDVRDALGQAMKRTQEINTVKSDIQQRKQKITEITQEQDRIRSNMKTVDKNSKYYTRLMEKLDVQETEIEKLQLETETLLEKQKSLETELAEYLNNLSVG